MKLSPDNEINPSFIDISRIKCLFFLLRSCFFRTTRPLASCEATAYDRPVSDRTVSIPERDQRPCDLVFTNSWLVRQRHTSWIMVLPVGKNPQKEWTRSLLAVPFVRGHSTVTPATPRNDGVYTRQCPRWHAMRGVFTSLPAKHKKLGMRVYTLTDRLSQQQFAGLYGIRCEPVNNAVIFPFNTK